MVKNRQFILPALISILLLSCTMKDDIQRDIVIETDPIDFNIPLRTNIEDTLEIAEVQGTVDLNQRIAENTDQFTLANLRSAYITKFSIQLGAADADSVTNNIAAFSYFKVQLKTADKPLIQLGVVSNVSTQYARSLNFNITAATQQLQEYLSAGTLSYVITGVSRNATTQVIPAKAVATYKLTLGM
jgi:hypothetical protein